MANQMIALTGRPFQAPNLMGAAQQLGTFMTQRAQQEAAASQRDAARQKMDFERQMQGPQMREANLKAMNAEQKVMTDFFDISARVINAAQTPEDLRYGADLLKQKFNAPIFQHFVDQTIRTMPEDPAAFPAWRTQTKFETLSAKDQVPYLIEQLKSQSIIGEDGSVGVLTTGGFGAPTIKTPRSMVPAPPRKGTVSVEPSQTVEPGVGGPLEAAPMSIAPMMPGAKSPRLSADLASPLLNVRDEASYQQALQMIGNVNPNAANQLRRIMPRFDPARMEGIREAAFAEFEKVPQPSQGLVAGERGGMGGPYAAVEDGYVEASKPFRAKNPALAPYPGSAQVPLSRVAAEKRAEAQAQKDVDLAAEQAKKLPGKKQVSAILGKMRDAYEQLEKAEAIPSEKRGTVANALDYIGSSALGREAQKFVGTEESKYLSRIVNMRKALATAIKNATGMSAQEMNSNVELQLTLDTLTDPTQGIEAARMALADLEELYGLPKAAAPARAGRRQRAPNRTKSGASVSDW